MEISTPSRPPRRDPAPSEGDPLAFTCGDTGQASRRSSKWTGPARPSGDSPAMIFPGSSMKFMTGFRLDAQRQHGPDQLGSGTASSAQLIM